MKSGFKAGAGKAVLAFPDEYFPNENYYGIHDNMRVRVLLLESGGVRSAIAVMELPSVRPWELTDILRERAASDLGADYDQVWLIMSHDLSAPHVPTEEIKRAIHMDVLGKALDEACAQAISTLREAVVGYGEGTSDINVNRDVESDDGWWVSTGGDGPSDKTLSLIKFDDLQGNPIAVLYSYAIKSSILELSPLSDGRQLASGDVTGMANQKAEDELGAVTIFMMGAAGDQVPRVKGCYLSLGEDRKFHTVNLYEKAYEALEELSDILAADIIDTAGSVNCDDYDPVIRTETVTMTAQCKKPYPKAELPAPPVLRYEYEPAESQDIDIYAMRIGSAALIALKAEVTTPIFDRIKELSPFSHTLMATLANGGQSYIATDIDYERYTYPGLNTFFVRGTDKLLTGKIIEELKNLTQAEETSDALD